MYFAALKEDPLYMFTRVPLEKCLASFLEEVWRPLLVYMQELYSCPIPLYRSPTMIFYSAISRKEVVLKARNFTYERPQAYDITASRVFQSLNVLSSSGSVKGGYTTTLTVRIPKRRNHPFWLLDRAEPDDKLFTWDISEDTLSFQVTRWGPLEEHSSFNATQRAKDIIQNIRVAVSNPTHVHSCISQVMSHPFNHSLASCRVLGLGIQLNKMWKHAKLAFSTVCTAQTVEINVNFIQDIIDSNTVLGLSPLLKYYQV